MKFIDLPIAVGYGFSLVTSSLMLIIITKCSLTATNLKIILNMLSISKTSKPKALEQNRHANGS